MGKPFVLSFDYPVTLLPAATGSSSCKRKMAPGIIAEVPNQNPRFLPLLPDVISASVPETLKAVHDVIIKSFGLESDENGFRVLFQERDVDESSAQEFVKEIQTGKPCTVRVLFKLLGGKGGFGSLLKFQGGMDLKKKTTNFDACRDLTGRRLRHSKAVERIKTWMVATKASNELVERLTVQGPDKPKEPEVKLDNEYIRLLKQSSAKKEGFVQEGLQKLLEKQQTANAEEGSEAEEGEDVEEPPAKRQRTDAKIAGSHMDSLDMMSFSEDSDSGNEKETKGASSSSKA